MYPSAVIHLADASKNFFWVPTAIYFGKRPVFLTACFITAVAAVWAAVSTSYESLLAACVVGGFGGGASEALGAAIINVRKLIRQDRAPMEELTFVF
jgi:MFS family permease